MARTTPFPSGQAMPQRDTRRAPRLLQAVARYRTPYFFVLPAVLLVLVFNLYPLLDAFVLSFHKWNGIGQREFIGLRNYQALASDPSLRLALRNNFVFAGISLVGMVGLGFFLAVIIERRVRGWQLFKVAWFLPVIISGTVIALLWGRIYDPVYGPVNLILRSVGLGGLARSWLADPRWSLYAAIVMNIWQYSGLAMIILLAAMEDIGPDIHDAATLDGVNWWQRVRYVIYPLVRPVLGVVIMLKLINSFKTFDSIYVLTGGGPGESSTVLGILLYTQAFNYQSFGYASAIATFMFVFIGCLTLIYLRLFRATEDDAPAGRG